VAPDEEDESKQCEPRLQDSDPEAPRWDHIAVEFFQEGKEEDGYRFTVDGDQLFPSTADGATPKVGFPSTFLRRFATVYCGSLRALDPGEFGENRIGSERGEAY